MSIWENIETLEKSNINTYETRGSSCQFDETSKSSIDVEKEILNQYIELSPKVAEMVMSSDDYEDGSISFDEDGAFTWATKNGEYCMYSPRMRSDLRNISVVKTRTAPFSDCGNSAAVVTVIGPWYSSDTSFTDQYPNEAKRMSEFLGGEYTVINNENATVDAIANAISNSKLVIFDSHGVACNGTSYICLTSGEGITNDDYRSHHAINGGNWYGVDGHAIVSHLNNSNIKCEFLWMAMCEGMKKSGKCGMALPLVNNGLKACYGYSQSVSFFGDYKYEEEFFSNVINGSSLSEAFNTMTEKLGEHDPAYTNTACAYPIIVSEVDEFPNNPDSHQIVTTQHKLKLPIQLKNFLDDFRDGIKTKFSSFTKTGKSVIKMYNKDREIGTMYINKDATDESVKEIDGKIKYNEGD